MNSPNLLHIKLGDLNKIKLNTTRIPALKQLLTWDLSSTCGGRFFRCFWLLWRNKYLKIFIGI